MWIVALPADIFFAVGVHIDGRDTFTLGTFSMTLPAEFPFVRLRRRHNPGSKLVFCRCGMANGALKERMSGRHLGPFNLRMAGGAGTGGLGRCRIVWIVTGDTGLD